MTTDRHRWNKGGNLYFYLLCVLCAFVVNLGIRGSGVASADYATWFLEEITVDVGPGGWTGQKDTSATGNSGDAITLSTDINTTITALAMDARAGVLTKGANTLTTEYKLTGGNLTNPDTTWLSAGEFLAKSYNDTAGDGQILVLEVRATATGASAPAGLYDCKILLRATW